MLFWSGKPPLPAQGLEDDMIRTEGREFGRPGNNARKGEKRQSGLSLVRSLGANDANLPCKSRHISRHRAVEGRSREPMLYYPFSPVRQPPALALFYRYHARFCGTGGGWKVFRVVIPKVIISSRAGDESKILRKCNRLLNRGSPNGFRLIVQSGFLRIYRLSFGKSLRKFANFREILIKHVIIMNDCIVYIKLTDLTVVITR